MLTNAHQTASPPVVILAAGVLLLEVDDEDAPELEHDDDHEQDDQQSVVGAILDERPEDIPSPVFSEQAGHANESEDPEETEARRQAAEQIEPAALLDEVDPLRRGIAAGAR